MNLEEIGCVQKVQRYMVTMRTVFQPTCAYSAEETADYVGVRMEPMPGETG